VSAPARQNRGQEPRTRRRCQRPATVPTAATTAAQEMAAHVATAAHTRAVPSRSLACGRADGTENTACQFNWQPPAVKARQCPLVCPVSRFSWLVASRAVGGGLHARHTLSRKARSKTTTAAAGDSAPDLEPRNLFVHSAVGYVADSAGQLAMNHLCTQPHRTAPQLADTLPERRYSDAAGKGGGAREEVPSRLSPPTTITHAHIPHAARTHTAMPGSGQTRQTPSVETRGRSQHSRAACVPLAVAGCAWARSRKGLSS